MKKSLAALLLVTGFYACNSDKKTDKNIDSATTTVTQNPSDTLTYTYDSVKVYSKSPVSKNKQVTDTAKAIVTYPIFTDAATNKFVQDRVIGLTGKQEVYKNYKQLTTGFIKEFDDFKSTNMGSEETWFEDLQVKVVANYPNYIAILHTYVDYKGGAHPNVLFTYFNYNPKTYQTITLDSLITTEGMPKLRSVAENIFRKNEQLPPNANLSDGYFFKDGIFSLAETFTLTKEGIKFLYNPYEIKSYAAGTTELIVPFSKIKDIMKQSSILSNFN